MIFSKFPIPRLILIIRILRLADALAEINAQPQPEFSPDWDIGIPFGQPIQPLNEAHRPIHDMITSVREFGSHYSSPTLQTIEDLFPTLMALVESLLNIKEDSHNLSQEGWNAIIKTCARITEAEGLSYESETGLFVRACLLAAAKSPVPAPNPKQNEKFDEHPYWETPAPRVSVAAALPLIARDSTKIDEEVLAGIKELSQDAVPAVRYQIASRINTIYETAPSLMWQLIKEFSEHEKSNGVLQGLLKYAFWYLAFVETAKIVTFTKTIFDRVQGTGRRQVREACVALFLKLYIERSDSICQTVITDLIQQPANNFDETQRTLLNLRRYLVYTATTSPPARATALSLQEDIVSAIVRQTYHINNQDISFNSLAEKEQQQVRNLIKLAESTVDNLYDISGISGVLGVLIERNTDEHLPPTDLEKQQFLRDYSPVLTQLIELITIQLTGYGFVSITYRLTEIFEFLISGDPQTVFEWIYQLVYASKNGNFRYEHLATGVIVRIMERYLAEYLYVIRNEQEDSLIEILDTFVEAGWPEAVRLTYRLHDTFR